MLVQTHVTTEQARMLEARLAHTGDSQSAYVRKLILKDLGIIKTEDSNA